MLTLNKPLLTWLLVGLLGATLGACASAPTQLALTFVDAERMDIIRVSPEAAPQEQDDEARARAKVASFAFEPHWSPDRTQIAFTRINVATKAQRMLSLYKAEERQIIDIATMRPEDWTGYGFSPAWSPRQRGSRLCRPSQEQVSQPAKPSVW